MIQTVSTLLLFLLPLAYSPGPGNMFFAATGARFGFRATIPANLGYHLATFALTFAVGSGFGAIATNVPWVLNGLKIAGSIYILYLASSFFRAGMAQNAPEPRRAGFWDGALLLALNPKGYVILALLFSQFTPTGHSQGSASLSLIAITLIFTLNNLIAFSIWAAIGDRLASLFRNEMQAKRLNISFGLLLAAVAIWMLLD